MKYTLITGASAGIGKAMAYKFANEGHNLILVARRVEILRDIQKEIQDNFKVKVIIASADLSKNKIVDDLYEKVKHYDIELWINNAGFGDINEDIMSYDVKRFENMIDLNIKALTTLTTEFIKDNLETSNQVINVSSQVGYRVLGMAEVYSATKFYVSAFTEGMDETLKRQGSKMRAKVLAPGSTESEWLEIAIKDSKVKDEIRKFSTGNNRKTAEELAENTYELYKSDSRVGIIDPATNEFVLKDKYYEII